MRKTLGRERLFHSAGATSQMTMATSGRADWESFFV
jgi:hypothetical protein